MKLHYKYWTKSKGIGGFLEKPDDFAVREIIEPKFLRKFNAGKDERKYTLFLVKKRNLTTQEMIKKLASLGFRDIGYAGLKDKFSVSWQYVSAIAEAKTYESDSLTAVPVGRCKKIFPGNLIGNEFVITLHDCKNKRRLYSVIRELSIRGMPNYFGLQRFGKNRDNHTIGRYLVKRKFAAASKSINKNGNRYKSLNHVPKSLLKFLINAYQSWLFNEMLNKYMGANEKPCFRNATIFGYKTRFGKSRADRLLGNICKAEGIAPKDFRINELMLSCFGGKRKAFIKLSKIDYIIGGSTVKLVFALPKGSYATVLLREICKKRELVNKN
ncbi:MAG: tRNA pseudouridine(13) synthase TruD [Candidatus Aenigmarchaeota archaeon]|nr:tRNA pseudouridine(13) synthase TruD [Candidatus Aenigmarchaeota archaeon]